MMEQIGQVQARIKDTFYNNLFQVISQYETRTGVTATEIDARRAEAMVLLGPVLERLNHEAFAKIHERVFGIASRAGRFPKAPGEIQGRDMQVEFTSMIELAQNAAQATGIERLFQITGSIEGVAPEAIDNVDVDYGLERYSYLMNNDPKLIRSPDMLQAIRQQRQQAQQQQQQQAQAEMASKLAAGAKTMSETPINQGGGGGTPQTALDALTQGRG
jgi:hypothetical protein